MEFRKRVVIGDEEVEHLVDEKSCLACTGQSLSAHNREEIVDVGAGGRFPLCQLCSSALQAEENKTLPATPITCMHCGASTATPDKCSHCGNPPDPIT